MNYRPLGQGLAGVLLLAHATFLCAAASDAILVESRSDASIVLPNGLSANDLPNNTAGATPSREAVQSADSIAGDDTTDIDAKTTGAIGSTVELLPFQAPTEDPSMAGIEAQYQEQILQQEVQNLRGLVEELQFQLQRMRKTQDDRYLELDGRFQALREPRQTSNVVANSMNTDAGQLPPSYSRMDNSSAANSDNSDPASGGAATVDAIGVTPLLATVQSEKEMYDTALELIRNRQYDVAITQLQAVIDGYPSGDYAPNAYYWLGEVYAANPQPELEKAQQALAQVISSYPGHRKVPDAAFKLGKVYHLMGDCDKSRDLLSQVADQQQGKTVGKLAASYLSDSMIDCQF